MPGDEPMLWTPERTLGRIVERAESLAGKASALYLLDIDGSRAVRVCGDDEYPDTLEHGLGVGKDIPEASGPIVDAVMEAMYPGVSIALLTARGRGVGFLASDGDEEGLEAAAAEAAPWLEISNGFTDELLRARLRRPIAPEGMIQQNLLPPEISSLGKVEIAGSVLPAYDVGGDWFDHAVNLEGAWLGVGDGVGKGMEAAALATLSVGAFRAARVNELSIEDALLLMDESVRATSLENSFVTAVIARCSIESRRVSYAVCGHPAPIISRPGGPWEEVGVRRNPPLGLFPSGYTPMIDSIELGQGDQLMLYSDGVVERRAADGKLVGLDHLLSALADSSLGSAAYAVASVQNAVLKASPEPLRDDSTLLALRITD